MKRRSARLPELTFEEAQVVLEQGAVAILPTGSTEAHGPHLGLGTDVVIAEAAALRAVEWLREGDTGAAAIEALVLPPIAYGVTDFARGFAGTLGLPRATVTALVHDVGRAAFASGFRGLVVANAHLEPEHIASVRDAVDALRAEGLRASFPDKTKKPWALELGEEFRSGACHAGEYETSIVMAADPDLVRDGVRRKLPDNPASLSDAIRAGKKTFSDAGGPRAYFGYPARADRIQGEAYLKTLARMLVEAAREVMR